ncbi:hypothetical protein DVH24_025650 [Malus domestica]|uniref:Uncharacterized protein n=1 Tax=Malus domestica TaxID=3750 RepID=A0A498KJD2_MALDO|nr:hypothetical protein DVH24_025650 [Malus domestica]
MGDVGSYNRPPLGPNILNFLVGHPSWDCSRANSLNFRVSMEPEANELPKDLVLGRDENIHVRLTESSPLGDVGSYTVTPPKIFSSNCYRLLCKQPCAMGIAHRAKQNLDKL